VLGTGRRESEAEDANSDCGCFDRLAVGGAADRDCATDCDRDGTGGTGGGGASALFDDDGRFAPKVIDRDLRNVRDNLRRRVPVEEGEATDGARAGGWGDGNGGPAGGGTATFDGCDGGKDS
jgi:hypothetical protein